MKNHNLLLLSTICLGATMIQAMATDVAPVAPAANVSRSNINQFQIALQAAQNAKTAQDAANVAAQNAKLAQDQASLSAWYAAAKFAEAQSSVNGFPQAPAQAAASGAASAAPAASGSAAVTTSSTVRPAVTGTTPINNPAPTGAAVATASGATQTAVPANPVDALLKTLTYNSTCTNSTYTQNGSTYSLTATCSGGAAGATTQPLALTLAGNQLSTNVQKCSDIANVAGKLTCIPFPLPAVATDITPKTSDFSGFNFYTSGNCGTDAASLTLVSAGSNKYTLNASCRKNSTSAYAPTNITIIPLIGRDANNNGVIMEILLPNGVLCQNIKVAADGALACEPKPTPLSSLYVPAASANVPILQDFMKYNFKDTCKVDSMKLMTVAGAAQQFTLSGLCLQASGAYQQTSVTIAATIDGVDENNKRLLSSKSTAGVPCVQISNVGGALTCTSS